MTGLATPHYVHPRSRDRKGAVRQSKYLHNTITVNISPACTQRDCRSPRYWRTAPFRPRFSGYTQCRMVGWRSISQISIAPVHTLFNFTERRWNNAQARLRQAPETHSVWSAQHRNY